MEADIDLSQATDPDKCSQEECKAATNSSDYCKQKTI